MAQVTYACTNCKPVDKSILEVYQGLKDLDTTASANEASRVSAEEARVSAENERERLFASDHYQAGVDQANYISDHNRAEDDHATAVADHELVGNDRNAYAADHSTAANDHSVAVSDHSRAGIDHVNAANDHTRAESDHTRAYNDHTESVSATDRANTAAAAAEHATAQVGKYYGFYEDSSQLPADADTPGYAMVGETSPFEVWNFNGTAWSDSGTTMSALQGESAYDIAVDNGYVGTEQQWLASLQGETGAAAGFGTVSASVDANTGTPGVSVSTSGPNTAKNMTFAFSNLKGETGATPNISIGDVTTGAAGSSASATITGTAEAPVLNLTIPQGIQGNTGSSVAYPYELVNNETTNDATKGHTAQGAKRLKDQLDQLDLKVDDLTEELGEINPHITGRVGVDASNTDITHSSLPEYDDQYGIITLTLGTSGYLWVCLENDHFRITSGGVEIPMVYVKESGDLHCYVSAEKINAGTMMFRVESIHPIKSQGERVTITARSYTVTYGDAMPDFGYLADGEIVGTPAITCEAVQGSAAGTYDIVIARGTVEDDNCIYENGTLTIAKAELTVTADNKQVAVGGAMPSFTLQYSGFVLNEDASDLTTAPTCTTNAEDTNTEGNYNIVPAGGVSGNYSFTYVNGVLTIGDPVILTLRATADLYNSGSCGGYINTTSPYQFKTSTSYYGIIVDVRKYKGHKMRVIKNTSNFRIAVLKSPTLTNNTAPTFSTATGFTGLIDYTWGTGETEKIYTLPSDAAFLYVYVYNSSYSGTSFAPKIEILGVPPTAEYKNLTASLFSTNTVIGNDGAVYTGSSSAPNTVCTDYLDASVYTRLLVASFIKNNLPAGVPTLSVNLAEYDGNKKFIKREEYKDAPHSFTLAASCAYIRVMVLQFDADSNTLSGDTIRFDNDNLQIEGIKTS